MPESPPPPGWRYENSKKPTSSVVLSINRKVSWFDFSAPAIAWGGIGCLGWFIVSYVQRGGVVVLEGIFVWLLIFVFYSAWKLFWAIWLNK
jgi:hypothetical protein